MKTKILIGLLSMSILTSCNKWLDLTPETEPTEKQVITSADGYRSVLNGLYRTMGSYELYGRDLTFGIIDCMSQQYKLENAINVTNQEKYKAAGRFEYDHPSLKPDIEGMYTKAFNVIANANNLIQNIQKEAPDFFKGGAMERNLILGEAYAVRALMHFDMLRAFAPAPINDDGGNYIPYVDVYPNTVPSSIGVKALIDKVVADLNLARTLVEEWDKSLAGIGTVITGEARFYNTYNFGTEIYTNPAKYEDFFKGRGYRLNYYTITALLARVHNYSGDYEKAFTYAEEVVKLEIKDNYGMQKAYALDNYNGAMSNNWDAKSDLKTVSNLIFAIHNGKAYTELSLETYFKREFYSGSYPTWLIINKDAQKTFETKDGVDEWTVDNRSKYLIYLSNSQYPISGKYFISVTDAIRDKNAMVIPVIRSSELRYIIAEYYARNGNFVKATEILTAIRSNRGLNASLSINNWSDFQNELIREARREYISEGQLLYLYKRLNAPVNFGLNVLRPLTKAESSLPVPTIKL